MIRSLFPIVLLTANAFGAPAQETKISELKVGAFTFKVAAPWVAKAEPRMMSQGGFTLTGKDGAAPVEADFYHFGTGGGGGIEPNIKRW